MPIERVQLSKEYNTNSSLKKEDVDALQLWVKEQPYLREISELHLILFLHSCYYNMEATKSAIERLFSIKKVCPLFLMNQDLKSAHLKQSMDMTIFAKLHKKTPEGYNLIFITMAENDIRKFDSVQQMKLFDMHIKLWLEEEGTSQGYVFLISIEKFNTGHLAKIDHLQLEQFITYLQDALPIRLKRIHFINAGSVIENVMAIIKPFIKEELLKNIHIHKDIWDDFFRFVPQEHLPMDYVGEDSGLQIFHGSMKKKLLSCADFFLEDKEVYVESKSLEEKAAETPEQEK